VGSPLILEERPIPTPKEGEILIRVSACGLCRTDLHIIEGELAHPKLPLILGHQVVGQVMQVGPSVDKWKKGDRIGLPWLYKSCGHCAFCQLGQENLCDNALFTGYTADGVFCEYVIAPSDFVFLLPSHYSDTAMAPLLCAGMIGWRSLKMCGEAKKIGFFGFGSSAHILVQIVNHQGDVSTLLHVQGISKGSFLQKNGLLLFRKL